MASRQSKELICAECGKRINIFEKYVKNDTDGTVLCKPCYDELVEKGVIG